MDTAAGALAGLAGAAAALALIYVLGARSVGARRLDPLWLAGSFVSMPPEQVRLLGLAVFFAGGALYAVFMAAVFFGFGADGSLWAIGLIVGVLEWIFSGISLTYLRLVHPGVRAGRTGYPGPFALNFTRSAAIALLAAHLTFGMVAGAVYQAVAA